jgi:hypothetical protein
MTLIFHRQAIYELGNIRQGHKGNGNCHESKHLHHDEEVSLWWQDLPILNRRTGICELQ